MIPSTKPPEIKIEKSNTSEVKFFGEIDIDRDGNIVNAAPAWTLDQHIEKEKEEISKIRRSLDQNMILPENVSTAKIRLEELEKRVSKAEEGKPVLTGNTKDLVAKTLEGFGNILKDELPSRTAIHKNLVRAQTEYDKNTRPYIALKDEKMVEFAKKCNVKVEGDRVSRNGVAKVYSILAKALGENPNIEFLRKD